jgi:pantothenate kinase type III
MKEIHIMEINNINSSIRKQTAISEHCKIREEIKAKTNILKTHPSLLGIINLINQLQGTIMLYRE